MSALYLSLAVVLATIITTEAICPSYCSCYREINGRYVVECKKGGLSGSLDLKDMEGISMDVLKISAPEDNLNALTMSPNIQSFTNLEEIHITKSNIPILGQHFFYGLKKLNILNLSENNITQLLDHNFMGLGRLRELYLDDNRILSLPSGTFRHLRELRILSIQRNRMHEMQSSVFQQLERLEVLKLSGNLLTTLNPEVFKDVQELKILECRGCGLKAVAPEVYKSIVHLTHLDLGDNLFTHIPPNKFDHSTKLTSLKLDGNWLTSITIPTFTKLLDLRKLNIARNGLTQISNGAFENLTNLVELDISYNKLTTIDNGVLRPLQDKLEKLIISGNHLPPNEIKELLEDLRNLKTLHAADCGLADFEDNFVPENLKHLNLAGNYLSSLPAAAIPHSLIEADLSKNRFKGLGEDVTRRIENVPKLKLDGNPWSCDLCHIYPLLSRSNKSAAISNLVCAAPPQHENKLLGSIRREELNWCSTPSYQQTDANLFFLGDENKAGIYAAGASIVLFVITVIAIVGVLIYSRRHAAKYYTHEEKRSPERESIVENQSPLFGDDRELSFKFPLDAPEKKISIATIDEIKKEQDLANGT